METHAAISKKLIYLSLLFFGLIAGIFIGWLKGIPFVMTQGEYRIGVYTGESPFSLNPSSEITNPVLSASEVTDVPASFVADPFMVNEKGAWCMFFEVFNTKTQRGEIGLAVSQDGYKWTYKQIVLAEPFHLSFPCVFKWQNDYYMIPESAEVYTVKLYKALDFPTKWSFVKNILIGNYFDSSVFYYNKEWWLFTSDRDDMLHLFWANNLTGPWFPHAKNPIIFKDDSIARSGGRILFYNNKLFRFPQDCKQHYGNQVRAFEITELTHENYKEKEIIESPVLKPSGKGWNAKGMHQIDVHQIKENKFIACVDGWQKYLHFGIKY
jgi:hypothetical protein